MLDKFSEENLRVEFDRIKAERKEAGEKAKAAAEKAYLVEASQLAWDAYAHGVSKDIIHTANRDYYNASRRRALWTHYTPSEPIEDLRSRGKGTVKSKALYEWLDREVWENLVPEDPGIVEYVDGVKFFRDNGDVWRFGIGYGLDNVNFAFESLDGLELGVWWSEFRDLRKLILDEWNARHPVDGEDI